MNDSHREYPSFAIVIETDNLASAGADSLRTCLDSLVEQGPLLERAEGVYAMDGGEVPEDVLVELESEYPWLTVVRAGSDTGYIELKSRGAEQSDSEVVVFCDGDIRYRDGWLAAILRGFVDQPDAVVIAGETTTPIRGPYSLAIALTFVFPRLTGESEVVPSPTYWANNAAIRRSLFEALPIPDPDELTRGQNHLHSQRIVEGGFSIWRQPAAQAIHVVVPFTEAARRYFVLGRDRRHLGRLTRRAGGATYLEVMAPDSSGAGKLAKLVGRVRQVVRERPVHALMLPLALPIVGLLIGCYFAGLVAPTGWSSG